MIITLPALPPRPEAAHSELREVLTQRRQRRRPSNLDDEAWNLTTELRDGGGLYDVTVQIGRLESEYKNLDRLVENHDMTPAGAFNARMRITTAVAALKAQALEMGRTSQQMIDVGGLKLIMEAIQAAVQQHVRDPAVVEQIGRDATAAARAALSQIRGR